MSEAEEKPVLSYAGGRQFTGHGDMFREGELLVVRIGTILPRRCLLCGGEVAEGVMPRKQMFSWDASFQIIKEASRLEMGKSGTVGVYFCTTHRGRLRNGKWAGAIGMIVSGVVMLAGIVIVAVNDLSDVPRHTGAGVWLLMAGFACAIVSLFLFTLRTRTVTCERIEEGYLFLRGAGEGFLREMTNPTRNDQ